MGQPAFSQNNSSFQWDEMLSVRTFRLFKWNSPLLDSEYTHQLRIVIRVCESHFAAANGLQVELEFASLWGHKDALHLNHVVG